MGKNIFEVAEAEAERRVARALEAGATELSLAHLPIERLPRGVEGLTGLVSLDLSHCQFLEDWSGVARLEGLQSLDLSYSERAEDLGALAGLGDLRSLKVSGCKRLWDLRPLSGLRGLETLGLRACLSLEDLGPLAALEGLRSLNLNNCERVQDLTAVGELSGLRSLDLDGCGGDLAPVGRLAGLEKLKLGRRQKARDLIALASLNALQSLDLQYSEESQDLTPLATFTSLRSLRLWNWYELRDLKPVGSLRGLESFNLFGCNHDLELSPLAGLESLQSLSFYGCMGLRDLAPLRALRGLHSLDLRHCTRLQDIAPITGLTNLESLDLIHSERLTDLGQVARLTRLQSLRLGPFHRVPELARIADLKDLRVLSLCACDDAKDLGPLRALAKLESLDLSYCPVRDLAPLAGGAKLQSLDLQGCRLLEDFTPLASFTNLRSLNLGRCRVQTLAPLAGLNTLEWLGLENCEEVRDLEPLAGLTALKSLHLKGCGLLGDVAPITGLAGLESLDLSECRQLECLSPLAGLTRLHKFYFKGCLLNCSPDAEPMSAWPLLSELYADSVTGAPSELEAEDPDSNVLPEIRAWQKDLVAGEAPNSALRVLILGNGSVGKTQVCRRLLGLEFDASVPSTHGIEFGEVQIAPAQGDRPEVRAKLWDFGGQSIYLGTHGLFLDDRAIYVIAWTPQHENTEAIEVDGIPMRNRPLAYWLEYVRSLAGTRAPVIVAQTQCDRESDVRTPALPAEHGFARLRITDSSAKEPDGTEKLQLEMKSAARYQLEQYGKVRLPISWVAIAKELEERRPQKTMAYAEFEELCRNGHKTAAPSAVLEYLHRRGQVFYRHGAFDNQVVLDLDWALDGIYAVLDRKRALPILRRQAGRFSPQLLAVLVWQKYGPQEHDLFLSLMQQCQICFEVAADLYVAPALLPEESEVQAGVEQVWRGAKPEAAARLDYLFLHEGVLRAVLCSLGSKAGESAVYWTYGICFYDSETKATGRIRSEFADASGHDPRGWIIVEAVGGQASELAEHLVHSIERVNIGGGPQVTWTVGGPQAASPEGGKSDEPFAAVRPAEAPAAEGERRPVYVSYAWGGESEALVDAMEAGLAGKVRLVRDRMELRPGDWVSRFMREIGRADCVLVAISQDYLRSFYCMRELLYVWQRSLGDRQDFLARVIPVKVGEVRYLASEDRAACVRHWEERSRRLEAVWAGLDRMNMGEADRQEWSATRDFAHHVAEMLAWLGEVLAPKTVEEAVELIVRRSR